MFALYLGNQSMDRVSLLSPLVFSIYAPMHVAGLFINSSCFATVKANKQFSSTKKEKANKRE
jgi:hypothetical protein